MDNQEMTDNPYPYPTPNWPTMSDEDEAQFLEEREEAALIADEQQRAMHNKDAQDGIDDYMKGRTK